jgi:hypothetical protein
MMMGKRNPIPVAWIKVYGPAGDYRASCVFEDDAAVLCAVLGAGSEARNGHAKKNAIWREGHESQSAAESYDHAANVMRERMTTVY